MKQIFEVIRKQFSDGIFSGCGGMVGLPDIEELYQDTEHQTHRFSFRVQLEDLEIEGAEETFLCEMILYPVQLDIVTQNIKPQCAYIVISDYIGVDILSLFVQFEDDFTIRSISEECYSKLLLKTYHLLKKYELVEIDNLREAEIHKRARVEVLRYIPHVENQSVFSLVVEYSQWRSKIEITINVEAQVDQLGRHVDYSIDFKQRSEIQFKTDGEITRLIKVDDLIIT